MAENENKTPIDTVTQNETVELEKVGLQNALTHLQRLEKSIFKGDGKIGGESADTQIDKKYNTEIEKATSLKAKIDIVRELVGFFEGSVYTDEFKKEYLTKESSNNISKIGEKTRELIKKYPGFEDTIRNAIQSEVNIGTYTQNFLEKHTEKNSRINDIQNYNTAILEHILTYHIPKIDDFIHYVMKNDQIKSKNAFIEICTERNVILDGKGFDTIMNLPIYKDNTTYEYGFQENFKMEHLNDMSNLVDVYRIGVDDLKKLNQLYLEIKKNPSKVGILGDYLDENYDVSAKNSLLQVPNIRKMYIEHKQLTLCINPDLLKNDNLVISLSNIQDKKLNYKLQGLTAKVLTDKKDGEKTIEQYIQRELGGDLYNASNTDKYYISLFTRSLIDNYNTINNIESPKLIEQSEEIERNVNDQLIQYISNTLADKLNNGTLNTGEIEMLESTGTIKSENGKYVLTGNQEGTGFNKIDLIRQVQAVEKIDVSYTAHEKPIAETKEIKKSPETKSATESLKKAGLGNEYAIDSETGKTVSKKWLEKKQQAIAKGDPIPKEENETHIKNIGRNGQIEFGVNNEMIFTSSLGYKFELENDIYGINKALDITETFDYMDKIGLGYFGNNLKGMIDSIGTYLPNQASFLSIDESSGNFLSIYELHHIIIPIFQNVGFIDKSQNLDPLAPEQMSDTVMSHRVSQIPGGDAFTKGKAFNKSLFGELLQNTNKV